MESKDTDVTSKVPSGWYPDASGELHYWDGVAWLDIPLPAGSGGPPGASETGGPKRRRWWKLIAVTVLAVVVVVVVVAWKIDHDNRLEAAEREAAATLAAEEAAAAQAEEEAAAAQAAEEERIRSEEAAEAAEAQRIADAERREREARDAKVWQVEQVVADYAQGHLDEGLIEGSILHVTCSPVAGGSLDDLGERTTVLECFVATKDTGGGTASGYFYNATVNWDTGAFNYAFGQP